MAEKKASTFICTLLSCFNLSVGNNIVYTFKEHKNNNKESNAKKSLDDCDWKTEREISRYKYRTCRVSKLITQAHDDYFIFFVCDEKCVS